jgi:Zn-dependent protease/predicted transcriptional regulator
MKSSWKIGALFGVAIRIHATFPLLLLWVAALEFADGGDWRKVLSGIAFTLAIFAMVVLHELGHALVAKRFGVRTRDITLLPIGGVARLGRIPRRPAHELWISLAGPAVNAVLALALLAWRAADAAPAVDEVRMMHEGFLDRLAWANVALAVFNLLPAYPMDGGRVLRAILALQIDPLRATNIAVAIGKAFAIILGVTGVATNPLLVMIAVFVWFGAEQEGEAARMRAAFEGVPVDEVMMTEFHVLSPDDELGKAIDWALAGGQQHFPVVADGTVVGMMSWDDLLAGLSASGVSGRVGEAMRRPVRTLHESDLVERVLGREREEHVRAMAVLRDGSVVGLFTPENLVVSLVLRSAAERGGHDSDFVHRGSSGHPAVSAKSTAGNAPPCPGELVAGVRGRAPVGDLVTPMSRPG